MFCTKCGNGIPNDSVFCSNCGAQVTRTDKAARVARQTAEQTGYSPVAPISISFTDAVKLFFKNYDDFNGRATKSEFWFAFLFQALVSLAFGAIPYIGRVVCVALLIPGLSISVRRLHDIGKNWTYILMGLIPIAGAVILIVYFCGDSNGNNNWGPVPTYDKKQSE